MLDIISQHLDVSSDLYIVYRGGCSTPASVGGVLLKQVAARMIRAMVSRVSKAFTKDDDNDVAPVPRRRAPIPEGTPNYVTSRGLRILRDELAQLGAVPSGVEGADARAAWLNELERRIAIAVVAPAPEHRDEVRFGATIRVQDAEGKVRELQIVGVDESDAARGLVAFTAPLARALLGRRVTDVVGVRRPGGEDELTIVGVTYEDAAH
jgi:transcription elongation factor GreB